MENSRRLAHTLQLALAAGELLDHHAGKFLRHVDVGDLHGLQLAVALVVLVKHLGLAGRELEALPAHVLDQHGQMKLAAAGHLEAVRAVRLFHPQAHVRVQLPEQAVPQMAGGDKLALLTG